MVSKTMFRREWRKDTYELMPSKTITSIRKVDVDAKIISMFDELIVYKKRNDFKHSPFLFTTSPTKLIRRVKSPDASEARLQSIRTSKRR